jgi:hypothetical protein
MASKRLVLEVFMYGQELGMGIWVSCLDIFMYEQELGMAIWASWVLKTSFMQQCLFVPCLLVAVDNARQALCWSEVGRDIASLYCCFMYELQYQSFFQFVGNPWLLVCILISFCIWLEALSTAWNWQYCSFQSEHFMVFCVQRCLTPVQTPCLPCRDRLKPSMSSANACCLWMTIQLRRSLWSYYSISCRCVFFTSV